VHAPATHVAFVQAVAVPHCPSSPHVCVALMAPPSESSAHCVVPGVQTPWHDPPLPLVMQAWLTQLVAAPHIPLASHVWTAALPEHCVAPGVHGP